MMPIQQQIEMEAQQEIEGQELLLNNNKKYKLKLQRLEAMTPEEVKLYMERSIKIQQKAMNSQLLSFLILKTGAKRKFTNGFKHVAIGAKESLLGR